MYNICMFLRELRRKYSFNLFVLWELLAFLFFSFMCLVALVYTNGNIFLLGFPLIIMLNALFQITGILLIILFVTCLIEFIFKIQITSDRFLNSKIIYICQNFGIYLFIAQIVFVLFLLVVFWLYSFM